MSTRTWTDSQQDAIDARAGTLLVAAAAGSGKTAVLVQRAVERLTDPERPTPADRLLVVTFTKAAAAEMRARLEKALFQLQLERPGDASLRRQSLLLGQAHIGTVDSFCAETVREFFHLLDLSPDFRILSDKQEEEMTAQAVSEALGEAFEQGTVRELADAFSGERDDRRLGEMVLQLYRFMQSHPFPERWLQEKTELYVRGDPAPWERVLLEYARESAEYCARLCVRGGAQAAEAAGPLGESYLEAFGGDGAFFAELETLCARGDWDAAAARMGSFAPVHRKAVRGAGDEALKERLEAVRREVKAVAESLGKLLTGTRADAARELRLAAPLVESLARLTLDFARRYAARKREENVLDYSDLEHFAVGLFLTPEGTPTPTAREVAQRFDEVMIDEYQDINEVQDALFRAISRDGKNLFMVGDVKQSIYSFRRAMPEIFLRCRRGYAKYDRDRKNHPAYLVLDRNFRSRREVVDTVNFVFSRLMTREAGDIAYIGEERLTYGAECPEGTGYETELVLLDRPAGTPGEDAEARFLAGRIRELVASGLPVRDGNGTRPVGYGDVCILLRSANAYAHRYAQVLTRLGVPARATVSGGFFTAAEIGVMTALLRVIDNPNQDIELLAVLMSPLYGFSADDAARLRAEDKTVSVYVSLTRAAQTDPRCAQVAEDLAKMRSLAATLPADAFLSWVYRRTGYDDLVLAMEGGEGRLGNLRLLQAYAREYETAGYRGVSGFVRFLDRLRESGSDLQGAQTRPDGMDAVSVMSIHRSKGLEFPVCIVAGLGRGFATDRANEVLLHPELGLGVRVKAPGSPARLSTAAREAIALETARGEAAEELRVLYVAMTRAREKLILLGCGEDLGRTVEKLGMQVSEEGIAPYTVRGARTALQWLILCGLLHPDGAALRERAGVPEHWAVAEDYTPWRIRQERDRPEPEAAPERTGPRQAADPALLERLRRQVEFVYPYAGGLGLPVKVAASRLTAAQDPDRGESLSRPAWMGRQGMTPAERGTALHDFMQYADLHRALEDPRGELERLVGQAFLTAEQAAAVDLGKVRAYLESDLGRRVLASGDVRRERRFTAVIPAALAQPDRADAGEETVILQGAVDCTFVEDGVLHIVDFKTDRVRDMAALWERYLPQVRLYAAAMEAVTGMPVGELFLYSTALNRGESRRYRETGVIGEKKA